MDPVIRPIPLENGLPVIRRAFLDPGVIASLDNRRRIDLAIPFHQRLATRHESSLCFVAEYRSRSNGSMKDRRPDDILFARIAQWSSTREA